MDLREELKSLVFLVKRNSKRLEGKEITNKKIAEIMNIGRTYLSDLLSGAKPVNEKHIAIFKIKLKDYLVIVTPEMALLNVLMEDYAEYKSAKENVSKEKIIEELKNKANLKLSD